VKTRVSSWLGDARARFGRDPATSRVLSWIRTIALEDDVVFLALKSGRGYAHFPFPSGPRDREVRLEPPIDPKRVRFVLWAHDPANGGRPEERIPPLPDSAQSLMGAGWRKVFASRAVSLFELDAPHPKERPLRLGVAEPEAWAALGHARRAAKAALEGGPRPAMPSLSPEVARLGQRSSMAVAFWTRGHLRGSMVCPAGQCIRATGHAAAWACKDERFGPLTKEELDETRLQVTFLHAPLVPLLRREIENGESYPDKAAIVTRGLRCGVYLPEIFNIRPHRKLAAFAESLAREKAGLDRFETNASFEICEVSEFVESADRTRAVRLDGPIAIESRRDGHLGERARSIGTAATAWLRSIQAGDGALPLRIYPMNGKAEGVDRARMALTAFSLFAFGHATEDAEAIDSARRLLGWFDRSGSAEPEKPALRLLTACYIGKAALLAGDHERVETVLGEVHEGLEGHVTAEPLILAQTASLLLDAESRGYPEVGGGRELQRDLSDRFSRALAGDAPLSLAEWAEMVAAFPPESRPSRDALSWLLSFQLPSGAFPSTTRSEFVYTRGTGKIVEVLALHPRTAASALDRSLGWLASMQYRPDSTFFVPVEHRARVLGGFRHDAFDTSAWIDAAAHVLLAAARLLRA
jgi:AMMECR1 domain-containing protein